MKIRRFIWVWPSRGKVRHIKYGNTSEGPTKCGVHVAKGWCYQRGSVPTNTMPVCARCDGGYDDGL